MGKYTKIVVLLIFGVGLSLVPTPEGLKPEAWDLFAIFITTIFAVITKSLGIFNASILALAVAILSGTLKPEVAYSGFSEGFILLIVVAFLVARGVIKSGLGKRIAYIVIKKIGKSTLGLGYATFITDCIIAPAFPSNTARSGVLYPIIESLAIGNGSRPDDGSAKKIGNYLMMNGIAGLSISSTLWFTAMAANPLGAEMAKKLGVDITFGSWFVASSVPSIVAIILLTWLLLKIVNPDIKHTPDAPKIAKKELDNMGPLSFKEKIMAGTFIFLVGSWALSSTFGIDKTAIAFLGLAILMIYEIFTIKDLKSDGSALSTFIWFSILFTLSSQLNSLGFMKYLGDHIATALSGFEWHIAYIILMISYILIHYFFVSQTAQMLALYGIYLQVGINLGVPKELLAYMLIFATNFFSPITPQGSSANIIFVGSGYLDTGELYKYGGLVVLINSVIYLTIGSAWLLMLY